MIPSPVSVRRSPSRSDEDDSTSNLFSPSSEYCHDISDLETSIVRARLDFDNIRLAGSSPFDSSSVTRVTSTSILAEQQGSNRSQNDGLFDRAIMPAFKGPENSTGADDMSVFKEKYVTKQKPLDFESNGLISFRFPPPAEDENEETDNNDEDDEIGDGRFVPDEILMDIINRLPVYDVMRWRCVSKKWKDITTTLDFIRLHTLRQCSVPTILVRDEDDMMSTNSMLFLDHWWDPDDHPKKHRFVNFNKHDTPLISHDGLLVMSNLSDFVIFNPLNRQQVINIFFRPETSGQVHVYGMFWHPNLKEYCIIFVLLPNASYHIIHFGPNPRCREVKDLWNHKIKEIAHNPVLVGNYLCKEVFLEYGDDRSILEFDIMTEEFKLIAPPLELMQIPWYESLNLINNDSQLSCVRICMNEVNLFSINIWTLKNHGRSQTWVCCNYNISTQVCLVKTDGIRAIAFVDGKLVLSYNGLYMRLYICDLKIGTSKLINSSYLKCGSIEQKKRSFPVRHMMSLVSLANCKSKIRVGIRLGPMS